MAHFIFRTKKKGSDKVVTVIHRHKLFFPFLFIGSYEFEILTEIFTGYTIVLKNASTDGFDLRVDIACQK